MCFYYVAIGWVGVLIDSVCWCVGVFVYFELMMCWCVEVLVCGCGCLFGSLLC